MINNSGTNQGCAAGEWQINARVQIYNLQTLSTNKQLKWIMKMDFKKRQKMCLNLEEEEEKTWHTYIQAHRNANELIKVDGLN